MSRVQGVEPAQAGLRTKFIYGLVKRALGRLPEQVKIRALVPKLLELSGRMDQFMASRGAVPDRIKELVQLKAAAMIGCPF